MIEYMLPVTGDKSWQCLSLSYLSVMISIHLGDIFTPKTKFKLENDPMCGITTGGREECFWDCELTQGLYHKFKPAGPIIKNPGCLQDCFDEV